MFFDDENSLKVRLGGSVTQAYDLFLEAREYKYTTFFVYVDALSKKLVAAGRRNRRVGRGRGRGQDVFITRRTEWSERACVCVRVRGDCGVTECVRVECESGVARLARLGTRGPKR